MLSLNAKWKKILMIQLTGYLLAILMSPISIRITIDERIDGASFIHFPIISFIVWGLLITMPVVYAYIKRIEYKDVCFKVLWIPPVMASSLCLISLLIRVILLLW